MFGNGQSPWAVYMSVKEFLTILRDLFMPQRRNACPHCGGVHCIGACQFNDTKVDAGAGQEAATPEGKNQGQAHAAVHQKD